MASARKLTKSSGQDKPSHIGITLDDTSNTTLNFVEPIGRSEDSRITEDEPYYSGITCEDTVSEDDRKFNEYLESELKLSEMHQLSHRKKITHDCDTFADDEYDEYDEQDGDEDIDKYYDEEYVAPSLHRKCTKTLLSWDEISVPDWDTESYLGTCSESEFAFDDIIEQPNATTTKYDQFDIAPEDDEDLRPRPRGTHTKPKVYAHIQYEEDDDEHGYWELLPGARRFGTI